MVVVAECGGVWVWRVEGVCGGAVVGGGWSEDAVWVRRWADDGDVAAPRGGDRLRRGLRYGR